MSWVNEVSQVGFFWWRMSSARSPCPVEVIVIGQKGDVVEYGVLSNGEIFLINKVGGEFWSESIPRGYV